MVRLVTLSDGLGDIAPQAIFWRPLRYFVRAVRRDVDDLDEYEFATFQMGNWLTFDLRRYAGHPIATVTLYLSLTMDNKDDITHAINRVTQEFCLPRIAVAWRREQVLGEGPLNRRANDRLREPEARLLALKVAAILPDRTATVQQIIDQSAVLYSPSALDLATSKTRHHQPQWHQIIRNVISHRHSANSLFTQGLATRTSDGLQVTESGVNYLKSLGYLAQ